MADIEGAVDAGADAVGIIFAPGTPKAVSLDDARALIAAVPAYVSVVAVFVRPEPELVAATRALGCATQFSGDEEPAFCLAAAGPRFVKALHVEAGSAFNAADAAALAARYPTADVMFDSRVGETFGGTGRVAPWDALVAVARTRRVIVSGGLTPENVGACVRRVRPFGVDVRSGVETGGVKDMAKVRAFVRAVRENDAQT